MRIYILRMIFIIYCMLVILNICATGTGKRLCPPGVGVVNCLVDPCDPRFRREPPCAGFYPGPLTCKSNFCGGCNAEWFDVTRRKVECNEIAFPTCPNPVACFADPCQVTQRPPGCPDDVTCVSNFCGGCNAVWVDNNREPHPCVPCATKSKKCKCRKCKKCNKKFRLCPAGQSLCPKKNECCCCKRKKFPKACGVPKI